MSNYENDADLATSLLGMSGLKLNMSPLPKKNMTTREILEHRLANYNDDMELKTPYSDNVHMNFDGENLNWIHNNKIKESMDAQSGQDEYQCAEYQNLPNKGPLPEGKYYVRQKNRQNFFDQNLAQLAGGLFGKGTWPGSLPAWGTRRVWLEPDKETETYGRSGFTIHGGLSKGSAGCIDIPWQTDKLNDLLDQYGKDVELYVRYPKKCW